MKYVTLAFLFAITSAQAIAQTKPAAPNIKLAKPAAAGVATTITRGALPTPTIQSVILTWQQGCPAEENCQFNVYQCIQMTGACSLSDPSNWLLLNSQPLSALTFTDTTVGAGGQAYSYVVFAVANGETSPPSNEVTLNLPLSPGAPAALTASAP